MTFEVLPGVPVYIGKLIVFDARGDGENEYQIDNERKHEITAFKRLAKKYKTSPWVLNWNQRLRDLGESP